MTVRTTRDITVSSCFVSSLLEMDCFSSTRGRGEFGAGPVRGVLRLPVRQQDVRLCSHQRRVQNLLRCWPSCQVNLVMFQSCTHWLSVLLKCTFYPSQNIVSMGTVIRRQIHCKLCLGMNNINYDLLNTLNNG